MAKRPISEELTAAQLRSVVHYDPETGLFTWRPTIDHWRAGLPAGTQSKKYVVLGIGTTSRSEQLRYYVLGVRKRVYRAHRLAWLYVYGEWPDGEIDHINLNGLDNRIANLRLATPTQNSCNRGLRKDNTSGIKGVSWNKRDRKWLAHITVNGKQHHLGVFDTKAEAKAVRDEAAARMHGEFAHPD